jgi:hypothetical protein
MSLIDLFIELATPNEQGESRWVFASEFIGKYKPLELGNGWSWGRASSPLQKKYKVEVDRSKTPGNRIDAIRLVGFNNEQHFSQSIRKDISDEIRKRKCVMLGVNGLSENTKIEVDHKDGRKNDMRVSAQATQRLEDFQPLCKAANDIKRQLCKNCKASDKRWDARNIEGNPYSFYEGDENYTESQGCIGCYQYDPVEYRIRCAQMLCMETIDYVTNKLYPNYKSKLEENEKR